MAKKVRQFILFSTDLILAGLALILTVIIGFWNNFSLKALNQHILPFSILFFFWFCLLYIFGLYDLNSLKAKSNLLSKLLQCISVCLGIGLIFFYLIPLFGITPKTNLFILIFIFSVLIFLWRKLFYSLFSCFYLQNLGILGQNKEALELKQKIQEQPQLGYRFIKFLNEAKPIQNQLNDLKVLIIVKTNQDIIRELYQSLLKKVTYVDLSLAYETILHKVPINFVGQSWFLKNLTNNEKVIYDKIKRLMDIVFSSLILLITSPVWLLTAVLIKIEDRGPVFYRQKRIGQDGKSFQIWKFRSMTEDAEKNGAQWADKQDKRRTKIGKIIRSLHIDEFPQMINVIKGDISLTGPRPERPEFISQLEQEIPHYQLRHLIKPGFTGWAQTRWIKYARTSQDSHEKFQYDLYYIKNRSLLLDLGILLKTFQLFFKKGS